MRYAEALAARGDHVDVIAVAKESQPKYEVLNGVRVFRIQMRKKNEKHPLTHLIRLLMFLVRASILVAAKHVRHRYNIVHVHSVPDFLVFAALVPRFTGACVILDIHDLLPELYADKFKVSPSSRTFRALRIVERVSAASADHVIAPNHIWREKLVQRSVEASKCSVFMNYPDPSVFSLRERSRRDNKVVLMYPGSLNWHQGLDLAIRAFAINAKLFPTSEFHIYGEGPERENLVQLAAELDLRDRVLFHAPLPLREIAIITENSDLGIIPKRNDGFGDEAFSTKSLEFMMLAVPIIIADTRVDKLYFNTDIVTFFRSGDIADLASCMRRLMEDKLLRMEQAAKALVFVKSYSWDSKKNDYMALVDRLTARVSGADVVPAGEAHF
ncbi:MULTISPECIES: glycosyltransferase family 4 protein [Acidobacteriaceae]|uniref:glycosyltransferase family 4 protein n=1 Tax=Acidobacteriaceae TaxID=204434 RepID=UPI00131B35A6|nr:MULTISPECIES: glycosyltransferase family 4 protein [Acidobacteriaceae]MDW5265959.1 glycosyltransferase family 4 protein [Edaphobacter sp.]